MAPFYNSNSVRGPIGMFKFDVFLIILVSSHIHDHIALLPHITHLHSLTIYIVSERDCQPGRSPSWSDRIDAVDAVLALARTQLMITVLLI